MPRVVDRRAAPEATLVFGDNCTVLTNDNPAGIGMNVDGPANGAGKHRVLVVVETHLTGLRHRRRQRMEPVERAAIPDQMIPLGMPKHRL